MVKLWAPAPTLLSEEDKSHQSARPSSAGWGGSHMVLPVSTTSPLSSNLKLCVLAFIPAAVSGVLE